MQTSLEIVTPDGTFRTHVARPDSVPDAPVVVVLHEVFGVNADMRKTCDELAAQGYIAMCPDLLWRLEPGVDLTDRTQAELEKAVALYTAFDVDKGVQDATRVIAHARTLTGSTGKVGVLGFCLGGLMSYLAGARAEPTAAVAYYPGNADNYIGEASKIECPLLVHLAGEDEYIPKLAQLQIVDSLRDKSTAEVHTYPGRNHAFARHSGSHYDESAATVANRRSADFLAKYLKA